MRTGMATKGLGTQAHGSEQTWSLACISALPQTTLTHYSTVILSPLYSCMPHIYIWPFSRSFSVLYISYPPDEIRTVCLSGGGNATEVNNRSKPLPHEFVSLYLRGRTDGFMLKGGDATKGSLTTMYDGPRPTSQNTGKRHPGKYQPMRKQGAIILATGGGKL